MKEYVTVEFIHDGDKDDPEVQAFKELMEEFREKINSGEKFMGKESPDRDITVGRIVQSTSRFALLDRRESAALHHALWSGSESATPYAGDCGFVYPKDVQSICDELQSEIPEDPMLTEDPEVPLPYEIESDDLPHASRGHDPGRPVQST